MTNNVAIIGLGKLGATMAGVYADAGFNVIGVDVNPKAVTSVNLGNPPVFEPGLGNLFMMNRERLRATGDYAEAVAASDMAFIIVPTPSTFDGGFDNGYVLEAVTAIGEALRDDDREWYTVVVCSTVMPGSTGGPIREALEATSGRIVGIDVGLCYSPEFIALGTVVQDMRHPDLVLVGAEDERSAADLTDAIGSMIKSTPEWHHLSLTEAELAKIAVNSYVTMKISYANTIGEICEGIGADASKVAKAVGADSRIGHKYLKPGAAFGGPCFPRDNRAFQKAAADAGTTAPLAAATDEVNLRQAERIAEMVQHCDDVAVLGLAYKPDTNVVEDSFGVGIALLLQHEGVRVHAYDPRVRKEQVPWLHSLADTAEDAVRASDFVIVATPWPEFAQLDYQDKPVIDAWGIVPDGKNVKRLGRG